jgi:hypothetical protein
MTPPASPAVAKASRRTNGSTLHLRGLRQAVDSVISARCSTTRSGYTRGCLATLEKSGWQRSGTKLAYHRTVKAAIPHPREAWAQNELPERAKSSAYGKCTASCWLPTTHLHPLAPHPLQRMFRASVRSDFSSLWLTTSADQSILVTWPQRSQLAWTAT